MERGFRRRAGEERATGRDRDVVAREGAEIVGERRVEVDLEPVDLDLVDLDVLVRLAEGFPAARAGRRVLVATVATTVTAATPTTPDQRSARLTVGLPAARGAGREASKQERINGAPDLGGSAQAVPGRNGRRRIHFIRDLEAHMPKRSWDGRRQREFERIRERLLLQGEPEGVAEQIATSRVNWDVPLDDGGRHLAMVAQVRSELRPPREQERQAWGSPASRPRHRRSDRRVSIAARRASSARLA